jgi:hypothetical protein
MVRNQALACNTRRENGVTVISRGNSGSRTRPRRTDPSGATTCRTTAPSGAPRSWTVMFVSDASALVRISPFPASVRDDPRYAAILRRMGLPTD